MLCKGWLSLYRFTVEGEGVVCATVVLLTKLNMRPESSKHLFVCLYY